MKILALGGCGDMGRMAVAILLESPKVTSITVADLNLERANTFVEMVKSEKLSAVQIDVTENKKLIDLISNHDLVVNTVGPFYKFGNMILKVCIELKKPYVDICDDWKPTLDMLELNDKAVNAQITALIGMGASPGITNLMTILACYEFDEVDEVITAWGMGQSKMGEKPKYFIKEKEFHKKFKNLPRIANAAIMHFLYETIETIPTYKNGKIIYIKSLTESTPIRFPRFKEAYACHIGHPEPITLPRVIKANSISNVMFVGKKSTELVKELRQSIQNNEITIEEAAIYLAREIKKLRRNPLVIKEFINYPPETCVIVTGLKNNVRKKVAIGCLHNPYGEMAGDTGVPLAIGALMLINDKITRKGVLTPEEVIDPEEFFDIYARYCGKNLTGKDLLVKEVLEKY